jgi:hypothetical protein
MFYDAYLAECFDLVFNYVLYKSIVDAHRADLINRALLSSIYSFYSNSSEIDYSDRNAYMVRVELTGDQLRSNYMGCSKCGAIQPR